ncbi:MAG: hypothetical protein KGZ88_19645 [Methylomicrobium sp.]|nr:hypothetical protein [Methylomicrobium sp.]
MRTPAISIVFFMLAALAGAAGQYLYKAGAQATDSSITSYLFNIRLWAGVLCYIAVMTLFVAAFKKGGSPSVLYPIYASTFIWAAILGWFLYSIPIKPVNILGMVCLVVGMWLMGL